MDRPPYPESPPHPAKHLWQVFWPKRLGFSKPLADGRSRLAAWVDLLFLDYGFLRLIWKNRARFAPDAFRQNQPYPGDVAWMKRAGIRTIVNLRHDEFQHGASALVREAAAREGLGYERMGWYPVFSREVPTKQAIEQLAELFRTVEKPILIHCKSGADRAGFAAALYRIAVLGHPVREARHELSFRYLHLKGAKTGILDAVFDLYLADHPAEDVPFLDWARDTYDPIALRDSFRYWWILDFIDRRILRRE